MLKQASVSTTVSSPTASSASTAAATAKPTKVVASVYSLRPRKVVLTVTHTVSLYNLRPRVKRA